MFGPEKLLGQLPKLERYGNMASVGDFNPVSANVPATRVEISVSCRNLLDRDTFSKSDPICVLYTQGMGNKEWREVMKFLLSSKLYLSLSLHQLLLVLHSGALENKLNSSL
uniref:Uncharacterized protein n=1 Tax=Naja naja TaxID=35670 RepID=A0A8C6YDK0_NAJNA